MWRSSLVFLVSLTLLGFNLALSQETPVGQGVSEGIKADQEAQFTGGWSLSSIIGLFLGAIGIILAYKGTRILVELSNAIKRGVDTLGTGFNNTQNRIETGFNTMETGLNKIQSRVRDLIDENGYSSYLQALGGSGHGNMWKVYIKESERAADERKYVNLDAPGYVTTIEGEDILDNEIKENIRACIEKKITEIHDKKLTVDDIIAKLAEDKINILKVAKDAEEKLISKGVLSPEDRLPFKVVVGTIVGFTRKIITGFVKN